MPEITARFFVAEVHKRGKGEPPASAKVILRPAYASGKNAAWAAATPTGLVDLDVGNPAAIERFEEWRRDGVDLHVTMTPVEE